MTDIYRPRFHFSARKGWLNDPNGMIVVDGVYHLFFQHNPDSPELGPQHWGHSCSHDLVEWEELPVALYPQSPGQCWSGSAVETETGEVKLFYTEHIETPDVVIEQQRLVHANRTLTEFREEPQNPVIAYAGHRAFRDPKLIWHAETKRWIMLITLGLTIGFYSSADLLEWRLESEFGGEEIKIHHRVWECPDLITLTDEAGVRHWALLLAAGGDALGDALGTRYIIGDFDGKTFTSTMAPDVALWLDYGPDFYAAQTFFNKRADTPIVMAWAGNWAYASRTPTKEFRGSMSCPRELCLKKTDSGMQIVQNAPAAFRQRLAASPIESGSYLLQNKLDLAVNVSAEIRLFGDDTPQFAINRTHTDTVTIRARRDDRHNIGSFAFDYTVALSDIGGPLSVDIFVDNGLVELCANDGELWITCQHFPENVGGEATIRIAPSAGTVVA